MNLTLALAFFTFIYLFSQLKQLAPSKTISFLALATLFGRGADLIVIEKLLAGLRGMEVSVRYASSTLI
jgi:hypothetical protein